MEGRIVLRIALYLVVLALIPLGFAAIFYPLYYFQHGGLVRQFRGRRKDAMALRARLEAANETADSSHDRRGRPSAEGVTCAHCGAPNERGYSHCQVCTERLPDDDWNL